LPFLKPDDSVHKVISMPRWQRDALNNYTTINFSGMVQEEIILPLIKSKSPNIYEKYFGRKIELDPINFVAEEKFKDKVIRTEETKKKLLIKS